MPRFLVGVLVAAVVLVTASAAPAQEKRLNGVALVIGQSAYEHVPALPNPANDARAMVKLLTDLGFDARAVTDRDSGRLERDLERFVEDAAEADVALLYYSGHGIEAGGDNWLLPVDVDEAALADAGERLVPLSDILARLKAAVPVTIVLLDACRTSPFPKGTVLRNAPRQRPMPLGSEGLTAVRGAVPLRKQAAAQKPGVDSLGTVIGFAAEPGLPALDGDAGGNSPYARALLRHLSAMQGVEFGSVMRMVTEEVYLETQARQRPWVNESLRRLLYFGSAPQEPGGTEGEIAGERRSLLLTMADLPSPERLQVEKVALREGVKLDSLYGILRALGTERMPDDPAQLDALLAGQAARLKEMLGERAALRTDDPQIAALSQAADRAIAEGAIQSARKFLDQAVARVESDAGAVDRLEDALKAKRLADAAIYARRADAAALGFEFKAAADDYARAYALAEKWDGKLAWNYKNLEAEALRSQGAAAGDRAALDAALRAYGEVLDLLPHGDRGLDWARTRNNMAVVLNTIGERETGSDNLDAALAMFREAMAVFSAGRQDLDWAAAQNNVGNILMTLGQRAGDADKLSEALDAYRAALAKRDRTVVPMEWAASQNNIGIAIFNLADQWPDRARLEDAEAAYRAALEVFTPERAPADRAMTLHNLGNTLGALGLKRNDPALLKEAAGAFEAALAVRSRAQWPVQFAATQNNLGNVYANLARFEGGTASLDKARSAFEAALEVFDRARAPLDWASAKNNLGVALQTLGQRGRDADLLARSAQSFADAGEVYTRAAFPMDWAMTRNNLGNTLQLRAAVGGDAEDYARAADAFREALGEYTRERAPMQWAMATASLGGALQSLSNSRTGTDELAEAIALRRDALRVLTRENAPVEWANAQNGLGMSLLNLSTRRQSAEGLDAARAAFEAAATVFTREAQPVQWAFAQNNIGDVHWGLATHGGGTAEYRRAAELFEQAKAAFAEAGMQPLLPLVDRKLELIAAELAKSPPSP